jgi:putative hydrolase of the HAD superfamily
LRAVLFDLGGTLEQTHHDTELRLRATSGFRDLLVRSDLDPGLSIPDLYAVVTAGMAKYQKWRLKTEQDLAPERLWSEFVFVDQNLPRERLASLGEALAFYWDAHFTRRSLRPEVPRMLETLRQNGYRLGVISNITSRTFVPHKLVEYGIDSYFQVVITSAQFHWRKPNSRIFIEAARSLGVSPIQCAYVGDTISRDIVGARQAGYALAIQIKSSSSRDADGAVETTQPDALVVNLMQVVDLVEHYGGRLA